MYDNTKLSTSIVGLKIIISPPAYALSLSMKATHLPISSRVSPDPANIIAPDDICLLVCAVSLSMYDAKSFIT